MSAATATPSQLDRFQRMSRWLWNRYAYNGGASVTVSVGGQPTRFALIEDAMCAKLIGSPRRWKPGTPAAPLRTMRKTEESATGPCDTCGHKDGHRIPGGARSCEACFYAYDPEADYITGG